MLRERLESEWKGADVNRKQKWLRKKTRLDERKCIIAEYKISRIHLRKLVHDTEINASERVTLEESRKGIQRPRGEIKQGQARRKRGNPVGIRSEGGKQRSSVPEIRLPPSSFL